MSRIAVLDLGTNTFHLLIVDVVDGGDFRELYRERKFVKLAAKGINKISKDAWTRGMQCLIDFRQTVDNYQVEQIKAVGTAALRTAQNGNRFIQEIEGKTGIHVDLIDGNQEAELIFQGVSRIWTKEDQPGLIMDIGGGSVEFIIADEAGIKWAKSYPIGVAVLFRDHHHSDPIKLNEQVSLKAFLMPFMQELSKAIDTFEPICLIGASGTFDVLLAIFGKAESLYSQIDIDLVKSNLHQIIRMNHSERKKDKRIPENRVDMIVVAAILILHILDLHSFRSMSVSQFALKEGLLSNF